MKLLFTPFLCLIPFLFFAQIQVSTITEQIQASGGVVLDKDGNIYIANFGQSLSNGNGTEVWKLDTEI